MRRVMTYGVVGVVSNALAYAAYLLLAAFGATPVLSMTLVYLAAATFSFLANRRLTFRHDGPVGGAAVKYLLAHGVGYAINLSILLVFVDRLGCAHQVVQAIAIFVVAGYLFVAMNVFVFAERRVG